MLGETCLIFLGLYGAIYLMYQGTIPEQPLDKSLWMRILIVTFVLQMSLYYNDLYSFGSGLRIADLILRIVQAIGSACIILAALYFLFPSLILGQGIVFFGLLLVLLFLVSWRIGYFAFCQRQLMNEKIFMIGDSNLAKMIAQEVRKSFDSGYTIEAVFSNPGDSGLAQEIEAGLYNDYDLICSEAYRLGVRKIIMALEEKRGKSPVKNLLECKMQGIRILDGVSFYEHLSGKILATKTTPSWLIFSDGFNRHKLGLFCKRGCDIASSLFGLMLFSPVMFFIAAAVRLSSPGPVFFVQERVGEKGRLFSMVKFRTMRHDAEGGTGAVWASENDPRTTGVGKVLRKFRLDEIPQFWNVLKGEMSFVGPRPERPEFVEQLTNTLPYYGERHSLKPGITGWAQVNYGYGGSEKDALRKLEYDLFYIKNFSLYFDLFIVLKTVKAVLFSGGAR
ncbi:MAG: TIGR03013 family PEP-CTERM/XrtA system glycosyltransferase [Desulfohalobiaceae bacterium]|nr:TIGR03013 family PEP-CTERM/XrtA system glycosyltransferase [Desulfohalobiaceae bacterium]